MREFNVMAARSRLESGHTTMMQYFSARIIGQRTDHLIDVEAKICRCGSKVDDFKQAVKCSKNCFFCMQGCCLMFHARIDPTQPCLEHIPRIWGAYLSFYCGLSWLRHCMLRNFDHLATVGTIRPP